MRKFLVESIMHRFLITLGLLASVSLQAAPKITASSEEIRILPVARTPESGTVALRTALPSMGKVEKGNPIWVQFRIDGYALGAASQFPRADEVVQTKLGQTVHVIVDDLPYFAVNEPAIDPFSEQGWYYDTSYKFEIPYTLSEGVHTLRLFPARSFGESLKGENTFDVTYFYVKSKTGKIGTDLSKPYLTYNEPSDQLPLVEDKPVLLDFYLTNCELSADGYKVRVILDEKIERLLTSWQPYYIYGLKKGKHTIHLELLDGQGKRVPGSFNDVVRTITVR